MRRIVLCFVFLTLIWSVTGCSNESDNLLKVGDLRGVWVIETPLEEYGWISRLEYRFGEDGIVEILMIALDIRSRDILGYRYWALKKYSLERDQLTLKTLSVHVNDDAQHSYIDLDNLQLQKEAEGEESTFTCRIEGDGNELVFVYPPCGPLENCIGSQAFMRED